MVAVCVVALVGAGVALAAVVLRSREVSYKQETPAEVIASAMEMIKTGRADKLPTLVYADSPEMRGVLNRLGGLFGAMQELAGAMAQRFPAEIAKYKAEAKDAVTGEKGLLALEAMRRGPRGGRGPAGGADGGTAEERANPQDAFQQTAARLLADPFGWIEANAARLTTVELTDDTAAVLFDGEPVPPLGLTLRKANGKWYVVLPTGIPGAERVLPQTASEWKIIASLVKVADNAVRDLAVELREGKIARLEQLAEKVGEKAFIPGAMVVVVYGKEMDVRNRRERAMTDFRKRLTKWTGEAAARSGSADAEGLKRFGDALAKVAVEELDKVIRSDTAVVRGEGTRALPKFEPMSAQAFEATVEGWLLGRGVKASLSAGVGAAEVEAVVKALSARELSANRRK